MSGILSRRVKQTASGGQTSRVSNGSLLLLSGDESGFLLLSGDAQSNGDRLKLSGDMDTMGGTTTRRVAA
jgi:hypothetical protein